MARRSLHPVVLSLWARSESIAVTLMSLLRRGAHCDGLLALVAESDLILASATAPTVFGRFWPPGFSREFGPRLPSLTGTLTVTMTLMSS
jgi:hypothetical protein